MHSSMFDVGLSVLFMAFGPYFVCKFELSALKIVEMCCFVLVTQVILRYKHALLKEATLDTRGVMSKGDAISN